MEAQYSQTESSPTGKSPSKWAMISHGLMLLLRKLESKTKVKPNIANG